MERPELNLIFSECESLKCPFRWEQIIHTILESDTPSKSRKTLESQTDVSICFCKTDSSALLKKTKNTPPMVVYVLRSHILPRQLSKK